MLADMVELADTLVLEASAVRRRGSSPFVGTILENSNSEAQATAALVVRL